MANGSSSSITGEGARPSRASSSCSLSFASKQPKPGRADSVERWDAHKKPRSPASSCGSSSPGRASSGERWDVNKRIPFASSSSSSTSSSSSSSRGSSSTSWEKLGIKRPPSRASSTDRWDAHKKARSAQADAQSWTEERGISDKRQQEGETTAMEILAAAPVDSMFSDGSSCFASPEPSMLPMPAFFSSRGHGMMAVPAH